MTKAKRLAAARKHRPDHIRLLIVAEAPPCTLDRYFYFPDVEEHDWLFRYVWEGLTNTKPERDHKAAHLTALAKAGVYLIDLHEDNISQPTPAQLAPKVPDLIERCRELNPDHIVLIKSSVYDTAFAALRAANLPAIDVRIPFPASGQQKKFLEGFRKAASTAGFSGKGL